MTTLREGRPVTGETTVLEASKPEPSPVADYAQLQVSVVLPCLNEAASVGAVVRSALQVMREHGIKGEVVVSDNGSTDGSSDLARAAGARVVAAPSRGYGNAYHAGMAAALGRVLLMADADGTYPMEAIPALVAPVLAGERDMVIGSRLQGRIHAMPWTHRYIGNPILTGTLNRFFRVRVSDAHSGMRAIDRVAYHKLGLTTPGMEYASEMIVQAARSKLNIAEIPIEYRERIGESKLDTWPDGWRHLKYLLLASPTWLFLVPGVIAIAVGTLLLVPLTFGPVNIGPVHLILHPIFFGAMLCTVGYQMLEFGVLLRACTAQPEGVRDPLAEWVHHKLTLERVLVAGAGILLVGVGLAVATVLHWALRGFPALDDVRQLVTEMTLVVVGVQTIIGAFLYAFFLPAQFGGGVTRTLPGADTFTVQGIDASTGGSARPQQ